MEINNKLKKYSNKNIPYIIFIIFIIISIILIILGIHYYQIWQGKLLLGLGIPGTFIFSSAIYGYYTLLKRKEQQKAITGGLNGIKQDIKDKFNKLIRYAEANNDSNFVNTCPDLNIQYNRNQDDIVEALKKITNSIIINIGENKQLKNDLDTQLNDKYLFINNVNNDILNYYNNILPPKFELIGFSLHMGNNELGHYIAYTKYENQWHKCNDSKITPETTDNIMEIINTTKDGETKNILVFRNKTNTNLKTGSPPNLNNFGNSCYINAALQLLLVTDLLDEKNHTEQKYPQNIIVESNKKQDEAKRKAQDEAKQKEQDKAKQKAREEAKRKQEEAKRKEQDKAKQKAREEAKRKQEEAKRKEEANKKAREEANTKSDGIIKNTYNKVMNNIKLQIDKFSENSAETIVCSNIGKTLIGDNPICSNIPDININQSNQQNISSNKTPQSTLQTFELTDKEMVDIWDKYKTSKKILLKDENREETPFDKFEKRLKSEPITA